MKTIVKPIAFLIIILSTFSFTTDSKVSLFNGENLDNWTIFVSSPDVKPEELFYVEDGLIRVCL